MIFRIDIDDSLSNRAAGIAHALKSANEEVERRNAALPEGSPPEQLFTAQTYMEFIFLAAVDSWTEQAGEVESGRVAEAFEKATPEQKESVRTILEVAEVAEPQAAQAAPGGIKGFIARLFS